MNAIPLLFASGMTGIDVVAFSIMKQIFKKALSPGFAIISVILYSLQPLILWKALSYETLTVMNILWNLMSNILVTLVGICILGEKISYSKWAGIVFGFIAIFLFTFEIEHFFA